jgi:6,7-dimethyl-8-ribityllumazine synthase
MSGEGRPDVIADGAGLHIPIIAASWHAEIADGLIAGAARVLAESTAETEVIRVAGCFELAVVCQAVLAHGAHAVVALGVIIRGETPHFDYVSQAVTSGLNRVSLDQRKPIGFGVLTIDDEAQGFDRAGLPGSKEDCGGAAAAAALATVRLLQQYQP